MDPLTPRQYEVARYVALGLTQREIAMKLGISKRTVNEHICQAARRIPGITPPAHRLTFYVLDTEERQAA